MIYVVGSGPTGVACAHALIERGQEVTLLDTGLEREPESRELVRRLGDSAPEEWSDDDLERLRSGPPMESGGIPLKAAHGSLFAYRPPNDDVLIAKSGSVGARPSYARGGFSTVWGAGVMPYSESELADWPISRADLAQHFKAIFSFVDLAARTDGLAESFPLYSNAPDRLTSSRQATSFLSDLEQSRHQLEKRGYRFGRTRLAVRSRPSASDPGCVYCSLCLHGCPYQLIYQSSATLADLERASGFKYRPGIVVHRVRETEGGVVIAGGTLEGEDVEMAGSRVLLAAGSLSTTRIVLESLGAWNTPVHLQDSQYFLLPLLRYATTRGVAAESLHTLCQAVLRVRREDLGDHDVHCSVYTYNDLYERALAARLGPARPFARLLSMPFLGRLILLQGHLHSRVSGGITVRLLRDSQDRPGRLVMETNDASRPLPLLKKLSRTLHHDRRQLRAVPVPWAMQVAQPGRGFYCGGSFPMSRHPEGLESDLLGRPAGFQRIHAVDASVFPSIAATPITLTAMANAHRIGSLVA